MMEIREVGPHRIVCGDALAGGIEAVLQGEKADVVYTDPPWGQANLSYWLNKAGVAAAERRFDPFIEAFVQAIRDAGARYVFLEMGVKWVDKALRCLGDYGYRHYETWATQYRSGSKILPTTLTFAYEPGEALPDFVELPESRMGLPLVKWAIGCMNRGGVRIVLDPCSGVGPFTGLACHAHGLIFRGVEINRDRFLRSVNALQKKVG